MRSCSTRLTTPPSRSRWRLTSAVSPSCPDRLYTDRTRAYQVAVADLLLGSAEIIAAAKHAADHYRQEAIYVSYMGHATIIPARKG